MTGILERRSPLVLSIILLVGLGLRVYHLGDFSLWSDEAFTRYFAENSIYYLWVTGFEHDNNPPLYYTFIHVWMSVFGVSECGLRSLSVAMSLGTIVLVHALGRELENRTVGLLGAGLIALSPAEIWYAQEVRCYAMQQVAVSIALLGLARWLGEARPRGGLIVYVAGAVLAVYTHDTSIVFVAACNVVVVGLAVYGRSRLNFREIADWVGANLVVVAFVTPLILSMAHLSKGASLDWISHPNVTNLLWITRDVVGGTAANRNFMHGHLSSYLLPGLIALMLWKYRSLTSREGALLVAVPIVFMILAISISFFRPILIPRVAAWVWIPLSLVITHFLARPSLLRPPLAAVVALLFLMGLTAQYFPSFPLKENWRDLARAQGDVIARAEIAVLSTSTPVGPLENYLPMSVRTRFVYWRPDNYWIPSPGAQAILYRQFQIPEISTAELLEQIRAGKRVCVIACNLPQQSFDSFPPPVYDFNDAFPTAYEIRVSTWGYRQGN